jgi:hypothetical protein
LIAAQTQSTLPADLPAVTSHANCKASQLFHVLLVAKLVASAILDLLETATESVFLQKLAHFLVNSFKSFECWVNLKTEFISQLNVAWMKSTQLADLPAVTSHASCKASQLFYVLLAAKSDASALMVLLEIVQVLVFCLQLAPQHANQMKFSAIVDP